MREVNLLVLVLEMAWKIFPWTYTLKFCDCLYHLPVPLPESLFITAGKVCTHSFRRILFKKEEGIQQVSGFAACDSFRVFTPEFVPQ